MTTDRRYMLAKLHTVEDEDGGKVMSRRNCRKNSQKKRKW
jgi:hypothetical protein